MIVDTHCHLSINDYDNIELIIQNMDGIIITSGCDLETNKEVIELVNKYDNVYGTIGLHPEQIDDITDNDLVFIRNHINDKKIVGLGEIGLDYYWRSDNKKQQIALFKSQLEIAKEFNKPIVVHSRDAINDTYNILSKYELKGDIHCFSSSIEMAKKFIDLGYYIGVGGVLTFKNSLKLKEVVKNISINNILLETDSPYLSPEPIRGTKNEPSNVKYIANEVSKLKAISVNEVINSTTHNADCLFDLNL